jgi:hypothetical protein
MARFRRGGRVEAARVDAQPLDESEPRRRTTRRIRLAARRVVAYECVAGRGSGQGRERRRADRVRCSARCSRRNLLRFALLLVLLVLEPLLLLRLLKHPRARRARVEQVQGRLVVPRKEGVRPPAVAFLRLDVDARHELRVGQAAEAVDLLGARRVSLGKAKVEAKSSRRTLSWPA